MVRANQPPVGGVGCDRDDIRSGYGGQTVMQRNRQGLRFAEPVAQNGVDELAQPGRQRIGVQRQANRPRLQAARATVAGIQKGREERLPEPA